MSILNKKKPDDYAVALSSDSFAEDSNFSHEFLATVGSCLNFILHSFYEHDYYILILKTWPLSVLQPILFFLMETSI